MNNPRRPSEEKEERPSRKGRHISVLLMLTVATTSSRQVLARHTNTSLSLLSGAWSVELGALGCGHIYWPGSIHDH